MRIAVLGRTHWLLSAARQALISGHTIGLVATAKAQPEYSAGEEDFRRLAGEVAAPFLVEPDVNGSEFRAALAAGAVDIAISVNWPTLIREASCSALRFGILNGHAGDLPRYRGNACPNWAILNDESRIGLCVHAMDPSAIDAGPVYSRRHLPLDESVYITDVYRWIEVTLPGMFVEAIQKAGDSSYVPEPQAAAEVRPLRCHPRRPQDGQIDWTRPAEEICRLVRATSRPFAGAFSYLEGDGRVVVWRARPAVLGEELAAVPGQIVGRGPQGGVLIACGRGLVEVEEAMVANGRPLPAANRYRLTSHAK